VNSERGGQRASDCNLAVQSCGHDPEKKEPTFIAIFSWV